MPDGKLQQLEALEAELSAVKRELRHRDQAWQAQLQIATRVHDSLLPRPVRHPQIDIDTRYVPVDRVGGDYCQVLFPGESSCYITMCDVAGHGVGESAGINRLGIGNERVLQRRPSQLLWPQAVRRRW